MQQNKLEKVLYRVVKVGACVLLFTSSPFFVFAGSYTTSISPTGAVISNPITATFNIQDFGEKDSDIGGLCENGFVPEKMIFNYWVDESNFIEILPEVVPTSEMISTGIYSATFNLPLGQAVYSIGVNFYQYSGGTTIECYFRGNQPSGEPLGEWLQPILTAVANAPAIIYAANSLPQNNPPSASFTAFSAGKIWSGKKSITYSATDPDQIPFGLKDFPISFYLSNDGGIIWKELTKNESNKGEYSFDTNNFPDGANYKLKITAMDNENKEGQEISGTFGIDNTPPTFEVSIDAEVFKEKDKINLKITSSENLVETPAIQITQSGGEPQTLIVDGFGKKFSASYTILKGHLGTAVVSIKGKDIAGNSGKNITSGGTFVVSRLGPPPPVIKNIVDNESFSEQKIDILGSAPSAQEVIFVFNKKDKFTVKPNEDGDFSFKNIILSPSDFGRNTLSFSSIDKKGLESDSKVLAIKLNSQPTLSWVGYPRGLVSGPLHLEWKTNDANNDELIYSLWYSADGGKNWDYFTKGLLTNQYELNTREFFDGDNYLIKAIVDDGTVTSEIVSGKLIFKNNNLFSITNAPKNYIFDSTRPTFKGEVKISEKSIVSLRYSLEKEEWLSAEAIDGKFDSSFEKFLIKFPNPFIDGKHILLIEAKDDKGNIFKTFQYFVIDTIPPVVSRIDFPSPNETINNSQDGDPKLGGIQIDVLGVAEAGTGLELAVNNRTYTASADSKGKFVFKKVTFLSRGINRYVLSSSDSAGNISKIEGFIISSNPPKLSLLTPQKGDFLRGIKEVKWQASDEDDDTLVFQISYRHKGDKNWISLEQNLTAGSYKLDASKLKEGAYELQVIANDGLTEKSVVEEIFIDNTSPIISLDMAGPILVSKIKLLFSGSATDNLSGIKFIEYSLDGKMWFKALIADGYLQNKASFVIRHPFELEDGEYNFGVRAIDTAGNISEPKFEKIIVDSTPPRIGSFIVSSGIVSVLPVFASGEEESMFFEIPKFTSIRFAVSLERDTKSASLALDEDKMELFRNKATGLWETDFLLDKTDKKEAEMFLSAEDALGNKTSDKKIGKISIIPSGKTISGAKITVFSRREDDYSLFLWPAEAYGVKNPVYADVNGEYSFLLPSGKYQILAEKTGYQRLRTSDFEILNPRFINFDLELKPRVGLRGKFEDLLEKFLKI